MKELVIVVHNGCTESDVEQPLRGIKAPSERVHPLQS